MVLGCDVESLAPKLLDLRALLNQETLEDATDQDQSTTHIKSIVLYKTIIRGGQSSMFTYKLLLSLEFFSAMSLLSLNAL